MQQDPDQYPDPDTVNFLKISFKKQNVLVVVLFFLHYFYTKTSAIQRGNYF